MKKRVLITIDTDVHREMRVIAAQLGLAVSRAYEEGAQLYVARHAPKNAPPVKGSAR